MNLLPDRYALRDLLIENLEKDLVGPASTDEVLAPDDAPLNRYIVGVLWPQADRSSEISTLEDDPEDEERRELEPADPSVAVSRMSAPSSCGLSFAVDASLTREFVVSTRAAQYVHDAQALWPSSDHESDRSGGKLPWRRVPARLDDVIIPLDSAHNERVHRTDVLVEGKLHLQTLIRPADPHGMRTITVTLVNPQIRPMTGQADENAWFQVGFVVTTPAPTIVDRTRRSTHLPKDVDLRNSALLYRDTLTYAAGHGCTVGWKEPPPGVDTTDSVWTTWIPRQEVGRARPGVSDARLDFAFMCEGAKNDVLDELQRLVDEYRVWIRAKNDSVTAEVPPHLRDTAQENLAECEKAASRMEQGIDLLRTDDDAYQAFHLANRAMRMQRARQDWVRSGSSTPFSLDSKPQSWRPFQIAFILINLPSLTDRDHPEREISDLLWFPAGGGKTEAYLGLIAYLVFLRRLRDPKITGVAVLMRYTLRLLTAQQFERAAMLICSLEQVRREDEDRLGYRPFGIGLWVGQASTPNHLADAAKKLRDLRSGSEVEESNPVQLRACPWCGAALGDADYSVSQKSEPPRMTVRCPDTACMFHGGAGLPVHLIDEAVYDARPELVIGTVDKFAMTAWTPAAASLFGRVHEEEIGPDLIIQDELHLISGPLGSTVGIYETAVDWAAGRVGKDGRLRRPKIVTSTATIRRASDQIRSVFDRESRLFPPPGLDLDQTFFSQPASREEMGTREYVGVLAPGVSQATLMVRTYSSLLHSIWTADVPDSVKDPYWTLIGYFNSLRVLGSAYLQVSDDIEAGRLRLLAQRDGVEARKLDLFYELTSRVPSSEIPKTLKHLEVSLGHPGPEPLDVVLATNMISVGLDVDRLGLMAVMGQPPSSSEYIQATSRVGRKHPGLVVTIYNASKSRDRSHFETFSSYHRSLYRAVEASSATPFAPRSRDRSLAGMLVAGLRMADPSLRADTAAGRFSPDNAAVEDYRSEILRRVASVTRKDAKVTHDTRREVDDLLMAWAAATDSEGTVRQYRHVKMSRKHSGADGLITPAGQTEDDEVPDVTPLPHEVPWRVAMSMRDVDVETALQVKRGNVRPPSSTNRSRKAADS